MAFAAHLSKSNGNSLEARVNHFRVAYAAYRDIQMSQSLHQQADMHNGVDAKRAIN